MNKFAYLSVVIYMMVMESYAAPIKSDPTTQDAATTSTANIPELLANAKLQVFHLEQSVGDLERETVSTESSRR